jgi:hypothetical protein
MLITVMYLIERARCRARAALDGHPEAGALTLEWIVIAGILVTAAVGLGAFLVPKITSWEAKVP